MERQFSLMHVVGNMATSKRDCELVCSFLTQHIIITGQLYLLMSLINIYLSITVEGNRFHLKLLCVWKVCLHDSLSLTSEY